jgi:hypothetical protein
LTPIMKMSEIRFGLSSAFFKKRFDPQYEPGQKSLIYKKKYITKKRIK